LNFKILGRPLEPMLPPHLFVLSYIRCTLYKQQSLPAPVKLGQASKLDSFAGFCSSRAKQVSFPP
jgi:hypothetical protein